MLDPAVEILAEEVDEHVLLCHTGLEPHGCTAGEGLVNVVESLIGKPVRVGDLRAEYDDTDLLDEILTSLAFRGFARVTPERQLTESAALRRAIIIDLDSVTDVMAVWRRGGTTPEVLLRCARCRITRRGCAISPSLAGTGRSRPSRRRPDEGRPLRRRHARESSPPRRGRRNRRRGVAGPEAPIDGLAELVRGLIATHVVMSPGASLLEASARERCVEWIRRNFVTGLCIRLAEMHPAPRRSSTPSASLKIASAMWSS